MSGLISLFEKVYNITRLDYCYFKYHKYKLHELLHKYYIACPNLFSTNVKCIKLAFK